MASLLAAALMWLFYKINDSRSLWRSLFLSPWNILWLLNVTTQRLSYKVTFWKFLIVCGTRFSKCFVIIAKSITVANLNGCPAIFEAPSLFFSNYVCDSSIFQSKKKFPFSVNNLMCLKFKEKMHKALFSVFY